MTMLSFCSIMYYSMVLAMFVVPLWFARGRLFIRGHYDFKGEFLINYLGMTGVVVFHVLLWKWERYKRAETKQLSLSMAWSLLVCYLLHIAFQIFFVDDDSNNEGGWSVASKYLGVEQELSRTIGGIIAIMIWIDMIIMVGMSYFTPSSPHVQPDGVTPWTGMEFFRERMYNTLRPATLLGAIWYAAGHAVLGNCFGWGGQIAHLYAIPTFVPFHIFLWRRERKGQPPYYENHMVDPYMAIALGSYYMIHFAIQFFMADGYRSGGSTATLYFGIDDDTSFKVSKYLIGMLFTNMTIIGHLTCFKRRCYDQASTDESDDPNDDDSRSEKKQLQQKDELEVALLAIEKTNKNTHHHEFTEDEAEVVV